MKSKQWYKFLLGFLLVISYETMTVNEQDLGGDAEDMKALFETESEGDALAMAAAQTTIMQSRLEVKPPSRTELFARRVWDRMLIAFLWLQAKYLAAYRYFKRGAAQQPAQ